MMKTRTQNTILIILSILGLFSGIEFSMAQSLEYQVEIGDEVTYEFFAVQYGDKSSKEVTIQENDGNTNITIEKDTKLTLTVTNLSSIAAHANISINNHNFKNVLIDGNFTFPDLFIDIQFLFTPPPGVDMNSPYMIQRYNELISYFNLGVLKKTTGNITQYQEIVKEDPILTFSDSMSRNLEMDGEVLKETWIYTTNENFLEFHRNMKTGWIEYYYGNFTVDNQRYEYGYQLVLEKSAPFSIPNYPLPLITIIGVITILHIVKKYQTYHTENK